MSETIVYELHVRGFTALADLRRRRTRARSPGVIEKIPYLQALGVTAVELLPVFEFDERECAASTRSTARELRNFWGYNPYLHFAPQASYCVDPGARASRSPSSATWSRRCTRPASR